jgi:ribosomal protein S18 acetylase RimI-like enzyme
MTSVRGQVALTRRRAGAADLPLLRSLFADAHLELAVLPTDTRFVLVDMQFRAQRRQHAANHPQALQEIIAHDGVEVARVIVDRSADVTEIVDISVAIGHRREGIAGTVLGEIVQQADVEGRRATVTVWRGNSAAAALVEAAGFVADDDQGGYVTYLRSPGSPDVMSAS